MRASLLSTLGAAALLCGTAMAQSDAPSLSDAGAATVGGTLSRPAPLERPRICLVLSGGGARGAAHIGVLRVLEMLRVPVDCIAGTSMGSLVGAAYASGMTPDEMAEVVSGLTTRDLFSERPPRRNLSMRRKMDDRTNLFTPEVGVRDGRLQLPKGAVTGVQVERVLRALVRVPGDVDFDKLPIPYRAVATDLVAGTPVVFSRGELVRAMRASMSVPGVVSPVEYNGTLLVDGGLTDNLPVDVARRMGADIIIAVNLGTPLMPRDELGSIIGVTGQMVNILTEQNVRASLASLRPGDILIEPALGDFSAGNFDRLSVTIPIGETAALEETDRLAALSIPPEQYAALRERQRTVPAPDVRPVDEIRLAPLQRVNPEFALSTLRTRPNEPLDAQTLDSDMERLFGTGDFEHVNYRILEEPGRRILGVDAIEKSWGPDYVRFGLGLATDFRGEAYFNLLASHRRTWINALGAEWRNDLQAGQTSSFTSEFYQPIDVRQRFFVAPRVQLERRPVYVYSGKDRIATYDLRRLDLAVDVGARIGTHGEARLGVLTGQQSASLRTGPASLSPTNDGADRGAITTRLLLDQLDSTTFPRAGYAGTVNVYASMPGLGADQSYVRADADGTYVVSYGRHTLNLGFKAGSHVGGNPLPRYDYFQWGGFLHQSGFTTGELLGGDLQFGRAVYYNRLAKQSLLEGIYAGASLEVGRMGRQLVPGGPTGVLVSGSLFLGLDTPVGPLYLAYGKGSGGRHAFYLFLGRP
ncbi:patatin-like phospholipase family protein [Cupriavidus respiraculi]|uniref:Outer membrane protein assembly factor BamA n=1 Tax=Cupriavidus respiraculi TaxID=195930 RepID=A0ABN7Y4N4_9BURK|nr:patatin-like phospholipase family protein [Cupriavidus respiraculi]CAG9166900.1 Outer membrane protein assembly factor BamA [Cupriavidus respiraculi]